MKKIYALFVLCCFYSAAFSQLTTVTINATGAPGSYKTGYAVNQGIASTRVDGDMQVRFDAAAPLNVQRGWAVFDIKSVIPPNSTVTKVKVRFTISATSNASDVPNVGIYGYVGDLSQVTDAALVWAGCNGNGVYTGTSFIIPGNTFGGAPSTQTDSFNASGIGFIHDNWDTVITIGWQSNATPSQTYTMTGYGGTPATQPQLIIEYYCNGIAGVSASASPNPLCVGTTLSLTGAAIGATSYSWTGPVGSGFSSSSISPALVVSSVAYSGDYVFSAFNAGGCPTRDTISVLVNPLPSAITGASVVCVGSTTPLTDLSGPGTWSSSNPAVATIGASTGIVGGVSAGTVNTTFTITATGCQLSRAMDVYAIPTAITGPGSVCDGSSVTLTQTVTTGTWSSSDPLVATINPAGVITTVSSGTTTITYSNGCAPDADLTFTVNPLPSAIEGDIWVCSGSILRLSDAISGGAWSSSNTNIATVGASNGIVSGVATGIVTITYALPTTCNATKVIAVNPALVPIMGANVVCEEDSILLANLSISGGTWSTANTTIVKVNDTTGYVTGLSAGTAIITFSNACGSSVTYSVLVNPLPALITGPMGVCLGLTTEISNATPMGTWSIDNPAIATIEYDTAGVVTSVAPGVVIVSYTLITGCFRTRSLTVTPAPPPTPIVGTNTVCASQTITLSQETGVGAWSSTDMTVATVDPSSGVVTGVGMGTDTIKYTIGTGTQCQVTKTITVRPLAPITGADSICMGTTAYLANIVGPGTWMSSLPAVATIDPVSGLVTSVAPGVTPTIISYTTNTGCVTTRPLTVIAIPPPITGDLKACPGSTTRLSDATPGGLWSTANPGTATANPTSGDITGVFADTVTVYYTVKPGCSISALLTINPLPQPITGLNSSMCVTNVDSAFDATPAGVWSSANPVLTVTSAGVVTAMVQGSGVIFYTEIATGCSARMDITVHPLPVPVITYNKYDRTLYTDTYYLTYQWYNTFQGMIPGATSRSVAALYTQDYWVVVTDTFGCTNSSAHYAFDAALLGVGNVAAPVVNVYPNPANSIVYVSSNVNVRAVITAIDGKQVIDQENAKEINIRSLANGMYFITLYTDDKRMISVQKLIKE